MAGILHEFVHNTKILASQVNENFATVQNDMTELGAGINTNLTNEITKAKSDLLTDIQNVSTTLTNSKANTSANNFTTAGKAAIIDLLAPNYGAGYSISSGWTSPKAGWCYFRGNQDHTSTVVVGGKTFEVSYDTGDGQSRGSLCLFVGKGTAVTSFTNIGVANFIPCKGN